MPVVQNEFLLTAISDGNMKWAEAFQGSGVAPIVFQRETGFDLTADTALNGDITTASTSVIVDSSDDYDLTDGALVLWDDNMPDIVYYTTNTVGTETFSGVTNIGFAHEDGDTVSKLYKLPTNFGKFREGPLYGDGVRLNGFPLHYVGGPPPPGYFSTVTDGTNTFLWLPKGVTGSASIFYDKASSTIDTTDDTVDVPPIHQFFLVWHALSFVYMGREDDANKMLFAQQESEKILNRALRNRNTGKKIRVRSFGAIARDYTVVNGRLIPL